MSYLYFLITILLTSITLFIMNRFQKKREHEADSSAEIMLKIAKYKTDKYIGKERTK